MKITADFTKITGRIKPMHGVGQPPVLGIDDRFMHYLGEAGIPYSRLHDMGGPYGGFRFVDIPNIFRDFDADETLPESYDFTFTDWLITALMKQGTEPFFRLGVTIENAWQLKAYRIYPPADFAKWARICEHIIRHYNEGWANGFRYGIKYWEIWNEPEGGCDGKGGAMWLGTREEYFRLYEITANHLKACFGDSIKVGGYASCGFYAVDDDPSCEGFPGGTYTNDFQYFLYYFHEFLKYISSEEHKAPLDFYSWHTYSQPDEALKMEDYCRRTMAKYGFGDTEDILNEWNPTHDAILRSTPMAAARVLAMMLGMQKKPVGMLNFYDARIGTSTYSGMFNPDTWRPYLTYYAFMMFNDAYKLKDEIETASDDDKIYVGGAAKDGKAVLLIANPENKSVKAELTLSGVDFAAAEVLMIDASHQYTPTGIRITDGKLTIPAHSCVEIRF
ncbi:MAG: hypothetical protein IJ493_04745 [Clostridia bacterium]|nr:hypothetical protein [Clostridia bacterium]